ncbi:hypothetical protein QQS21_012416, partial [Conoideocrella luteorostrata]
SSATKTTDASAVDPPVSSERLNISRPKPLSTSSRLPGPKNAISTASYLPSPADLRIAEKCALRSMVEDFATENRAERDKASLSGPATQGRHGRFASMNSIDNVFIPQSDLPKMSSEAQNQQSFPVKGDNDVPDAYANLNELAPTTPAERIAPRHESLDRIRSREKEWQRQSRQEGSPKAKEKDGAEGLSQLATQVYTLSYLVFFAIMGTLARLGLTALTHFVDTPVLFTTIWANFGGSLIMGFLAEDRMLFRQEWGTPHYDQALARSKKSDDIEGNPASALGSSTASVDLASAKKAHLACKKTIPLYVGLATGFCGSFTSFSTFIRDVFLAMSNDIVTPGFGVTAKSRNGGYSFMAMVAVIITTVALSLSGLRFGAHCAIAMERITPSFPYSATRKFIDPLFVVLGWGCWLGAVLMAIFPPNERWRGQAVFALVFAPLGCLARFYLALYLNGKAVAFPVGTFTANVFGTAVLGVAWDIAHVQSGGVIGCQVLQGVEDGFCGCLTTVSTWVAELNSLRRRSAYLYGATSVVVSFALMVLIMGGLRWTDGWSVLMC